MADPKRLRAAPAIAEGDPRIVDLLGGSIDAQNNAVLRARQARFLMSRCRMSRAAAQVVAELAFAEAQQ